MVACFVLQTMLYETHFPCPVSLVFSADRLINCHQTFCNLQGNVFIWKLQQDFDNTSIEPVTQWSAHKEYITRILLSPDVKKLATCSADHTAKIWRVTTDADEMVIHGPEGKERAFPQEATLMGHQRWVWDCAFSADSAYLVTACSDHYARLWELSSQTIIRQYNGHHRGAVCVALNDYSDAR